MCVLINVIIDFIKWFFIMNGDIVVIYLDFC